ncbi:PIN-like domain-containing protein [Lysinibacillus xylanilyticus]|uniref:PIN-like domain-containing protein n=1 Tax=Lysinibacillus xylanilyticus TaxID=582475 RepID=UPI003CFDEB30
MKHTFNEFYTDYINLKKIDEDTVIVFDANTLLHIYRYSTITVNTLLKAMEMVKKNIWLPYQAALEFNRNRQTTKLSMKINKEAIEKKSEDKIKDVTNELKELIGTLDVRSKDSLDTKNEIEKNVEVLLNKFYKDSLKKEIDKLLNIINTEADSLDKIVNLFNGKIGKPFSKEILEDICKEGKARYDLKIPPGYMDAKKNTYTFHGKDYQLENKYGDLVFWKEIINYAKETKKKNVVIVSDDGKEDWIYETKGRKIGTRVELKKELLSETGANLLIINTNTFISSILDDTKDLIIENVLNSHLLQEYKNQINIDKIKEEVKNEARILFERFEEIKINFLGMGIMVPRQIKHLEEKFLNIISTLRSSDDFLEILDLKKQLDELNIELTNQIKEINLFLG